MVQINFCLVFSNKNYNNMTASILLNTGIISYNAENPDVIFNIINNKKIDFIFLDLDFANNASFKFLDKLKEDEKYSSLYIIITSFNTNEKFIKELQKYNIISFIAKPLTKELIETKINLILNKFRNHFSKRKHIRVQPSKDELMRISFKLKNKKHLTAKIIDISLGGIAALLYTNYQNIELKPGNLIEHIIFEAHNKEIDVDAKIINKKETFIALKFTHFYNNSNKDLTKYIMKKLSV